MRAFVIGLLFLFAGGPALGADGDVAAVRQQMEASLRVTGTIDVDAGGLVTGHRIDQPDSLDPGVLQMIGTTLPHWRFQPVVEDGKPRAVTADMSLLLLANKTGAGQMRVRITRAHFARNDLPAAERSRLVERGRLVFPSDALHAGVSGTVFVVLKIDRQGNVLDAVARQVNLRYLAPEREMDKWRSLLGRYTVSRAKTWKFHVPASAGDAETPWVSVTLPVDYQFAEAPPPRYGKWEPYIPGPRADIDWLDAAAQRRVSGAEALADGQLARLDEGLELLTPLDEG